MNANQSGPIKATQYWLEQTVIGLNLCPFAKREFDRESIYYQLCSKTTLKECLIALIDECERLDQNKDIETSLLIFNHAMQDFDDYLELLDIGSQLLAKQNYEGIYQLASFHPDYCFDGVENDDPSNYTNRSPYPMLHLLREKSIETALEFVEDPEQIPERNIQLAQQKGGQYFQKILQDATNK